MDYRLLYPSLYLSAADLKGKDQTLTIRRVIVEELKTERGSEKKPVVYFEETKAAAERAGTPDKEKRMVLNKTNARMIARIYNENEIDNWRGKKITLYPQPVSVGGEMRDGLRIRPTIPVAATARAIEPEPTTPNIEQPL